MYLPVKQIGNPDSSIKQPSFFDAPQRRQSVVAGRDNSYIVQYNHDRLVIVNIVRLVASTAYTADLIRLHDRNTWSASASLRRRYADLRVLSSSGNSDSHGPYECMYQRGLILSVQSNQFVQSKMQLVQFKMRNCAVQKHKVEDIIVQFSNSILIISLRNSIDYDRP